MPRRLRIRFSLAGFFFTFLLTNLLYLLPVVVTPTRPATPTGNISNVMEHLNYQSDSLLMTNLYKSTREMGYMRWALTLPVLFMVGIFIVAPRIWEENKRERESSGEGEDEDKTDE